MPQFMYFYLGGEVPTSPEEGQKHFQEYQQWLLSLGDAVLSPAIPFKNTHTVHPNGKIEEGSTTAMSGISIMDFNSMQEALETAKTCPFLKIKGTLEVTEMIEISASPEDSGIKKPN